MLPSAKRACSQAFDVIGNPRSVHRAGVRAARPIRELKDKLAEIHEVSAQCVHLCFSGSDANMGFYNSETTTISPFYAHPSHQLGGILKPLDYWSSYTLKESGLAKIVGQRCPFVYRESAVDPVTGCTPYDHTHLISSSCGWYSTIFVDAQQSFLKKFSVKQPAFTWDAMTVSSHKIGGPMGISAVIIKNEQESEELREDQELAMGSINPALAAGWLAAIEEVHTYDSGEKYQEVRDTLVLCELKSKGKIRLLTPPSPNHNQTTFNLAVAPTTTKKPYNEFLLYLDDHDICLSEVTACSSKADPQQLKYYGCDPETHDFVRLSIGPSTTMEDIRTFSEVALKY